MFGVSLVFVGVLDCMLSWRGGFQVDSFYTFLILSGVLLIIVGTIRQANRTEDSNG